MGNSPSINRATTAMSAANNKPGKYNTSKPPLSQSYCTIAGCLLEEHSHWEWFEFKELGRISYNNKEPDKGED